MQGLSKALLTVVATGVLAAIVSPAPAQVATTGQIVGTVQDSSGGSVPGAVVRLENEATRSAQSATAGAGGGCVLPAVMPGASPLTVTVTRFQPAGYHGLVVGRARTPYPA